MRMIMDENINLAKILKDCPKDWSLYSPVCGYVHFVEIAAYDNIIVVDRSGNTLRFMSNGMYRQNGECLLFPSYSNNIVISCYFYEMYVSTYRTIKNPIFRAVLQYLC